MTDQILTKKQEAAKLAEADRRDGWRHMMATPASRRVMWEQFEIVSLFQVSRSIEPGPLAFNEGRRSVAIQLVTDLLNYCPEQYDRMVVENRARLALEKTESDQEADQQ
jgi:hypothetical protein